MCHGVPGGRNTAECAVGTLMVVAMAPVLEHVAHLVHAVEDVAVEHLGSYRAVEAFDQRVLCRLTRLDEAQLDQVLLCPLRERMTDQLGAVVEPQALWFATKFDQLIKRANHTAGRQAGVDLDPQRLAAEVIDDVEGAETPDVPPPSVAV